VSNDDKRYGACGSLCQGPHAYGIVSATHGGWCDGPAPVPPVADEPTDLTSRVMMTQADAVSPVAEERAGGSIYEAVMDCAAVPVEGEEARDVTCPGRSACLSLACNAGCAAWRAEHLRSVSSDNRDLRAKVEALLTDSAPSSSGECMCNGTDGWHYPDCSWNAVRALLAGETEQADEGAES
jgi:hypothetical protein